MRWLEAKALAQQEAQSPRTRLGWLIGVFTIGAAPLAVQKLADWFYPWLPGQKNEFGFVILLGVVFIYSSVQIVFEHLNPKSLKALPVGQWQRTVIMVLGCLLIGTMLVCAAYRWPPA